MKYLVNLIILLFSLNTYSQIVDNPPYGMFQEFPQIENHGMGIGNLGFDSPLNVYNPHYITGDSSNVRLFIGSDFAFRGTNYTYLSWTTFKDNIYRNPKTFIPSLELQYWYNKYLFQLSYYQDYSMFADYTSGSTSYVFNTPYGTYGIASHERKINIRDNVLQFTFSHSPIPQISYTLGILSRSFKYEWDIRSIPPIVNKNSLLDNFQFIAGVTANPCKYLQAYITAVSESPRVGLSDPVYRLSDITVTYSGFTKVSYYGILGYGIQANIIDPLKVSIEMRHQFLYDTTNVLYPDGYMSWEKVHIWNNEITLGLTLSLFDMVKFGYRYSYFLKYDNYKGFNEMTGDWSFAQGHISHPSSFAISGSVNINRFNILASYQHSSAYYGIQDLNDHNAYEDKTYLFSLSVGYSFSLSTL